MTQVLDLTIQPVARRSGLEANTQSTIAVCQLLDHPFDRRRRVRDFPAKPDLARPATLGDRHRVLRLGYIKCDKCFAIFTHGPPSLREARLGTPEQPSFLYRMKGRATGSHREHDV